MGPKGAVYYMGAWITLSRKSIFEGDILYSDVSSVDILKVIQAMVYQRSGAGNRHFCDLLAKIEHHINMILNLFFTGNAIQSCYGRLKSTGGRSKNGIFRVYTVKNDRNRHENDVICGPSLCFVSHVCTESAIFPQPPVDLTQP